MLSDSVKSIRETVGGSYAKIEPNLMDSMPLTPKAIDYLLDERGLTKETIAHFKLGYSTERDAIAIPMFKRNELINIKYRALTKKKPRYCTETKTETWIYNEVGLAKGLEKGSIIIAEGEFDLMSIWQAGSVNVISPATDEEAFGSWIEYLDGIKKVYIAYDNDDKGKTASLKLAERVGVEKCLEIIFSEKDANEFFIRKTREEFIELAKSARPYYSHQYKGLGDVINSLQDDTSEKLRSRLLPYLKLKENAVITLSADTNVGKTTFCMNLVDEMSLRGIPCLVLPFEDGIEGTGQRFLQAKFDLGEDEISMQSKEQWARMIDKCVDLPVYFAHPKKEDTLETIIKSKRYFDTKIVILDHIGYMLQKSNNLQAEIGDTVKALRTVANKYGIIIVIVAHIRKLNNNGGWKQKKEPDMDDLKDSSSLKQDVPIVIMLTKTEQGLLKVNPLKAKGKSAIGYYKYNCDSGRIGAQVEDTFGFDDK
jgi:5S rRNA maturation endonuclease (ribonuclease M5)/nucleoside-triphosphatase THEP1